MTAVAPSRGRRHVSTRGTLAQSGIVGAAPSGHGRWMDNRVGQQAAGSDALWRALQSLRSTATWLMFGAHPDDEWSGFLAWLTLGRGIRAVYACATRGDGGQNALGAARGADLAAVRSREMECAAAEIGFGLRWMTPGGDDPISDFGFSRSGVDTLARWGERRLVERMAQVIRKVRPDAVSPTFLDVPGQHGHHRAVTAVLPHAMALAADARWSCGLVPWCVTNAYLPAFSGGGTGTYDDELPPPPATVSIDLGERSTVLGASWAQVGERSRRFHATQGMGCWIPDGPHAMALHKWSGPADRDVPLDDAPHDVASLASIAGPAHVVGSILASAEAIDAALAAWPDYASVVGALHRALGALKAAWWALEGVVDLKAVKTRRLLARKRLEVGRAAALALGMSPRLVVAPDPLRPGGDANVVVERAGSASVVLLVPDGWRTAHGGIAVPPDAVPIGTLRDGWEPLGGNDILGARLHWMHEGIEGSLMIDPASTVCIAPAVEVSIAPSLFVRRSTDPRPAEFSVVGAEPPTSWQATHVGGDSWHVVVPPGRTDLPALGARLNVIASRDIGRTARVIAAATSLLGVDAAIDPGARVGVVTGETDTTLLWLEQLGIDAVALNDAALGAGDFSRFTTILIGMFGYRQRPALASMRAVLLRWIESGGRLVTLYHRPVDAWDPEATPPRRLYIGTPSLRWRVTDPTAPVRVLAPEAQLLRAPNSINDEDWAGWVRERGLYLASEWDSAYRPLLEIADAGETPLRGALLEAKIGRGSHVHVALALHYQWEALVPGAFRLLANLVAREV
jgi:LmbE family N-acetylglucosaminyl deacetylase